MTALREYLAEHPAAEQIGVFDAELETLPARFTIGTAASRIELRHPDRVKHFSSTAPPSPKPEA